MECEMCDKPMPDDYPYDICPECCVILKDAMKEKTVSILDEDGRHSIN